MNIAFSKYQGAGNDFILIKDIEKTFPAENNDLIRILCDRRFGIGADGLMLLRSSDVCDFEMKYFNSDGYEGTMCGNGGRCLVKYARDCEYIKKDNDIIFSAIDGKHQAKILSSGDVLLQMSDVLKIEKKAGGYDLYTGSMHHVEYVDNLVDMDVYRRGRALRHHNAYAPAGCNVNFICEESDGSISIRTYERGVENETLACGTGSIASAITHHYLGNVKDEYVMNAKGGTLRVSFKENNGKYQDIWLQGPATFVFNGEWQHE